MSRVVTSKVKVETKSQPSSSRSKSKSKPPPPTFSTTADPLSEDEFDAEVKKEAQQYAAVQQVETARARIKEENKTRRDQGLKRLALPRRIKVKKAVHGYLSESDGGSGESVASSDEGSGAGSTSGKKRKRGKDKEDERPLTYEGQRLLPFNPLYPLSGQDDPAFVGLKPDLEREPLLSEYFGKERPPSAHTVSGIKQERSTSPKKKHFDIKADPDGPPSAVHHAPTAGSAAVDDELEEEPEGNYEDAEDDQDEPLVDDPQELNGDAEEEGVYSDDERFADTSSSLLPTQSQTQNLGPSQSFFPTGPDVPATKPRFPYNQTQSSIGPLPLDDTPGGVAIPAPINMFLKAYQRDGVRFFYDKYKRGMGGVLGDDMGLGKTVQVIAFLAAVMRKTNTDQDHWRRKKLVRQSEEGKIPPKHWPTALIVCPSSLVRNWQRELDAWGYFEHATWRSDNCEELRGMFMKGFLDVLLTSYDQARSTIEHLKDLPLSVVIADEAHRLKEPRSGRALTMKKIRCTSCFGLTGTLIQNRMEEMWSVLDFVQRGWAGTLAEWRAFAVNPIKRGHRAEGTAYEVVTGIMKTGLIYDKLLPNYYLRRDKKLIAHELPEKKDLIVFCPLAERQVIAYQRLIQSDDVQFILRRKEPCDCGSQTTLSSQGETVPQVVLKNIVALGKVANHFGLLYHGKEDPPEMRKVNEQIFKICTGVSYNNKVHNPVEAALDPLNCGKWTLLREWRDETEKKNKILIFSNSVRLLKMVSEFISTSFSGFSFNVFTGEANQAERMQMIDDFQDPDQDHFILLVSTQAGAVGLNLTAANKVVIFDPDWNPANDLQAMDRAFRIGQQRTVEVYRLIGLGTLEELKYERQIHKQQRARQLNEGTFERRIHQGMDGGKTEAEQGELFGTHNLFRFEPKGFVAGNLERVQMAEDRFAQDLINAEYDEEEEEALENLDEDDEDEMAAKRMRIARKDQEMRRAAERSRREAKADQRKLNDVLGDGSPTKSAQSSSIFDRMGIKAQDHEVAFRDSEAERQMYEMGLQLIKKNPALAMTMKANDLGKLGRKRLAADTGVRGESSGSSRAATTSTASSRKQTDPDDEPWQARFQAGKPKKGAKLIELSDDE